MKSTFICVALAILVSNSNVSMEKPTADPKPTFLAALKAFGLSDASYSVEAVGGQETPEPSIERWNVRENYIQFTKDIVNNPDLLTFAAYCSAAYIKNNSCAKSNFAYLASIAGNLNCVPAAIVLTHNHPHHCFIVGASVLAAFLAAHFDLSGKIADSVKSRLETRAFDEACQKLIEEKKFKPIATYYAFSKLIKHAPVDHDTQWAIITKNLNENGFSIEAILRSNSVETRIQKLEYQPGEKPAPLASVFYP